MQKKTGHINTYLLALKNEPQSLSPFSVFIDATDQSHEYFFFFFLTFQMLVIQGGTDVTQPLHLLRTCWYHRLCQSCQGCQAASLPGVASKLLQGKG